MSTQTSPRVKPYKELLTSSNHRRFISASALVLGFCWIEATLLSSDSLLLAWLPFGYTGLRTLAFYIPCLSVFIIRLSNLHFGERTTTSSIKSLRQHFTSIDALSTLGWYVVSAQIFGVAYIWSRGAGDNLGWVDPGRAYERPRVNENPIVLRCLYTLLAVFQTSLHLYYDYDLVPLGEPEQSQLLSVQSLVSRGRPIAVSTLHLAASSVLCTLPAYFSLLRRLVWTPTYTIAKMLNGQLPRYAEPVGPNFGLGLVWQAVSSALLLSALWGVSNAVFTTYMALPPLKKEQPLTSDMTSDGGVLAARAADANGSLINGLLQKRDTPHTFALWELYLICTRFTARRKSIFAEVDRKGGSSWSQISQQCLKEIEDIGRRIQQYQNGTANAQPQAQQSQGSAGLPRIASEQAQQGDILSTSRTSLSQSVSGLAKSAGQHPGAVNPISPTARRALTWSTDQVLSKGQQEQFSTPGIVQGANQQILKMLQTPAGQPFRTTFAMAAKAVVLGSPYSAQTNIVHASRSLAALLKASLTEDTCGIVAKDVPLIVRTLLGSIGTTQQFLNTLQPNWTDVEFRHGDRQVPEITEVISELRQALEIILLAFGEYASSLGMSKKELREAKEAVGMSSRTEMAKVR